MELSSTEPPGLLTNLQERVTIMFAPERIKRVSLCVSHVVVARLTSSSPVKKKKKTDKCFVRVYVVQLDTQRSFMVDFIDNIC
jgi:hypothetical protein